MSSYATIKLETREGGVALLTLDRPEVRNAINLAMVEEIHDALTDLAAREDVLALVLTGAGTKAFASGADIAELLERTQKDALLAINSSLFRRIEEFPRPTIAAVRGYALGGGCELALACDIRVAGETARFGQPEVSLGILPGAGATYRLPRLVGTGRARELIFTGRAIDAREAERIGLVNRVVPDERVLDEALAIARGIAEHAPLAVRLSKIALNAAARGASLGELESIAQAVLFESDDKKRRMADFLEKKRARDRERGRE
jgi:enoyl-CoA hydratase